MDFKTEFAQILNQCSLDIMNLMVQCLQQERITIKQQIMEIEKQLEDFSIEELTDLKKK